MTTRRHTYYRLDGTITRRTTTRVAGRTYTISERVNPEDTLLNRIARALTPKPAAPRPRRPLPPPRYTPAPGTQRYVDAAEHPQPTWQPSTRPPAPWAHPGQQPLPPTYPPARH